MPSKDKRKPSRAEGIARKLAGNVTIELFIAGSQVLRDEFSFSQEQIDQWQKLTMAQAKENRGETQ